MDPSEVMLQVIIDKEHHVDAQVYLHGMCCLFALALMEEFGYKVKFLRDSEEEGLENLVHVFCVVEDPAGTQYIDARGITRQDDLFLNEFASFFNSPVYEDVDIEELKTLIRDELGNSGYNFFFGCAKQLIRKYPKYYTAKAQNYIWSRNHLSMGEIKNLHSQLCAMESCTGVRMHVKWPDGTSTYPCSKGCSKIGPYLWQID